MKHVHVLGIYPFSHTFLTHSSGINQVVPNPVGFACVEADIQIQGVQIPGFAFLRGDSVAILPILRATEDPTNEFVLMTSQHRVPVGNPATIEVPAGMMDGKGTFAGTAAKEIFEETSLVFGEADLEEIGTMDPSVGGCDESIRLFRGIKRMPLDEIVALQGRSTGATEENEIISLQVMTMADFIHACKTSKITDAKAKCLLFHHLLA